MITYVDRVCDETEILKLRWALCGDSGRHQLSASTCVCVAALQTLWISCGRIHLPRLSVRHWLKVVNTSPGTTAGMDRMVQDLAEYRVTFARDPARTPTRFIPAALCNSPRKYSRVFACRPIESTVHAPRLDRDSGLWTLGRDVWSRFVGRSQVR